MRYGYKRHSLLTPILIIVIILCLAAVAVLTWALFRYRADDDGKIGTNVTSGKVKVDIEDLDGNSLVGDVFEFVLPEGEEEALFAPGYTYYTEGFRIKNEGNLDIKYRVFISEDDSIDSTAFAQAFDFYITKDVSNITKTGTNENSGEKLTTYTGALDRSELSDVYYLVITMKPDAGDEFQSRTFTGIGITVHATQTNATEEP